MSGREFHGNFGRRGEENTGKLLLADGSGIARKVPGALRTAERCDAPRIAAVVQEDGAEIGVAAQQITSSAPLYPLYPAMPTVFMVVYASL